MAQFISIIIVALGAWAVYRFLAGPDDDAGKTPPRPSRKDMPTLKRDPKTGIYRPDDD